MATGTIIPFVFSQVFDNDGDPAAGKKLWIYEAGTTTLADSWSDASLTTLNTNPIVLNAAARFNCFLASGTYDFYLALASDVTVPPTSPIATSLGVTVSGEGESSVFSILGNSTLNIAVDKLVYMSDGTSGTIGNWYVVDSGAVATSSGARLCGWTRSAIGPANAAGLIQVMGPITISTLGFANGSDVYVGSAGAATDTPPANQRWIGKMTGTQQMFINGFGVPPASSTLAGVVTIGTQTFGGTKTLTAVMTGTVAFTALPTGIGGILFSRSTSDVTYNNSTAFTNITGCSFAVGASETWIFEFVMTGKSADAADYRFTLTGPAAPTSLAFSVISTQDAPSTSAATAFGSVITAAGAASTEQGMLLSGILINGANAGTVQLQAAQSVADATNTIIRANSFVKAMRVA